MIVLSLSLQDLTRQAELIFLRRCEETSSAWDFEIDRSQPERKVQLTHFIQKIKSHVLER